MAGDVFDPADLNANLYRIPNPYAASSIHEVCNGRLNFLNFDPAFTVQPHHVRPREAGDAVSAGHLLRSDYFADIWNGISAAKYVPIGGAAVTWYQRYPVTMALFSASISATVWRQFGDTNGAFAAHLAAPDIRVRTFFGNPGGGITTLSHSQREFPQTVHFSTASTTPEAEIATREARLTRQFNLVHAKMVGGTDPCDFLTAGWHTFGIAAYVQKNLFGQDTTDTNADIQLQLNGAGSADARPLTYYSAVPRLSIYVRSCSAMRLL